LPGGIEPHQPELVTRVYREYADAGAQVIETNSFGANRIRLARFGLDHQVSEINWRAAQVAREAVKGRGFSSADRSGRFPCAPPTASFRRRPQGAFSRADRRVARWRLRFDFPGDVYRAGRVASGSGVFQNLTNIPVVTSLAVSEEGRLVSGESFPEAVKILRGAGADIVGINGTCGPQACVHLLSKLAVQEGDLISVYPNAGKPEFYEGRFNYAASAEYFADTLPRWVEEGARLIGGDYGTRPEHIAAMAAVARELKPVRVKKSRRPPPASARGSAEPAVASPAREEEVSILDLLKQRPVSIVELDSPKTLSMDKFLPGRRRSRKRARRRSRWPIIRWPFCA
jgi:hypothetical protein